MKKLFLLYKPYKKELCLDLLFSAIYALCTIAIPLMIQYILNKLFQSINHSFNLFEFLLIASIILFFILLFICSRYMKKQGRIIGLKIEKSMIFELFDHYQKLSYDFYDQNDTGALLSRMTVDVRNISRALHVIPEEILSFFIKVTAALIVFFSINVIFGMLTFVIIFSVIFVFFVFIRPQLDKVFLNSHESFSYFQAKAEESLSGIRTIQSLGAQCVERGKFKRQLEMYVKDMIKVTNISSLAYAFFISFVNCLIPIFTIVALFFCAKGLINFTGLIIIMLFTDVIVSPIWSILELMEIAQDSWAGYKRFYEILSVKPNIVDSPNAVNLENIKGNIEMRKVSFSYFNSNVNLFENLNLKIYQGDYVAIVGLSGAGKSTLCKLIPRFYEVSDGEILIDGVNVKNIKLKNLRENIGFVHQDTFLFSGTIMDNIRYGKQTASDNEIIAAAKNAYAHDFIEKLPEKYNTQVGQRGLMLSGGQRQRIAISRIFLKNPPILIFDEPTSSLDNDSEQYVQEAIKNLAENRTTIVVAHKLSTIKNAKKILVMDKGKFVCQGTHKELLKKNNLYSRLYRLL